MATRFFRRHLYKLPWGSFLLPAYLLFSTEYSIYPVGVAVISLCILPSLVTEDFFRFVIMYRELFILHGSPRPTCFHPFPLVSALINDSIPVQFKVTICTFSVGNSRFTSIFTNKWQYCNRPERSFRKHFTYTLTLLIESKMNSYQNI